MGIAGGIARGIAGDLHRSALRFAGDQHGGLAMRAALAFAAAGLALGLFGAPAMEMATTRLAENHVLDVDEVTTGSVTPASRYTIRKSVLSEQPQFLCDTRMSKACLPATAR